MDVEPLGAPGVSQVALALGDLVGVVGEGVVDAAAVDVQPLAQIFHGDAGALDVPAGIAHAPGGVPLEGLILKLGLGKGNLQIPDCSVRHFPVSLGSMPLHPVRKLKCLCNCYDGLLLVFE